MASESNLEPGKSLSPQNFVTTHWSVVLTAQRNPAGADAALEQLCRLYWWPLYAFVRRRGHGVHDAQDLTQEFFTRLLSKDFLGAVDRTKGKFRSFLLASMEHFLAKEWRRINAQKRGGGCTFISIDDATESYYQQLPVTHSTPEQIYDQQWAITLQQLALDHLKAEHVARGKLALYEATYKLIPREKSSQSRAELAAQLGMTEAALKMTLSRMRDRYVELLRAEVAKTVNSPEEIEEEIRAVFAAWA
jgi:RNA polymerase sigma-70 factor (ECF subfamily)